MDLTTYFHGDLVFKNFPLVGRIFANNYNTVDVNYFNYEMVHVPLPTNVYTMMAGYWVGWKWLGLIVGGLFHGCFWGYVYNRSRKSEAYKVLYVSILNVLVFYFFHDFLLNPLDYVIYSYQRLEEERIYIYILNRKYLCPQSLLEKTV